MTARTTIDPDHALARYLAAGPRRSLRRLCIELAREGTPVHERTLQRWSYERGWQTLATSFDAVKTESVGTDLIASQAVQAGKHAELGRALQHLALYWAAKLLDEKAPLSPNEIARWAEAGIRIERLAMGAATSRSEVKVTMVGPVLALYRQVVEPALPPGIRDTVNADFADGMNRISGYDQLQLQSGDEE